jgi:hypothetical protein
MSASSKLENAIKSALLYPALLTLTMQLPAFAQDKAAAPAQPPARAIPGITAQDEFPRGCVDCHVQLPERNLDVRLSTLIREWEQLVPDALLAKAQAAAPAGVTLRGKHPIVKEPLAHIPADCLSCHRKDAKLAPPFARMLHAIHLTGGEQNHFLTMFQGECTHCHKLNSATGAWSLFSGSEK